MSKKFFFCASLLVALLSVTGCFKDPEFSPAEIGINPQSISFDKNGGDIPIKLFANREWSVELVSSDSSSKWLSVDMEKGDPMTDSVTVTVTALPNNGEDRYATLNFKTSTLTASLRVSQTGAIAKEYDKISSIRELYQGSDITLAEDYLIKATVISNYRNSEYGGLNNATSSKTMIVSDETAGISFFLSANNTAFAVGDVVEVKLTSGLVLQRYKGGSLQVNGLPIDNITVLTSGQQAEPVAISAADLLTGNYESRYVAISDVQVVSSDLNKTFVQNEKHTSINMESKDGKKFVIFSSSYSTYGAETVPSGSGTLKGIAMVYGESNPTYQISITSMSDLEGLSGERFDGSTTEPEGKLVGDYGKWSEAGPVDAFMDDFSSVTDGNAEYHNDNWLFYTTDGSSVNTGWKTGVYNSDKYIQVAPYSSSADQVIAFALCPSLNVAAAADKNFSFRKAIYYKEEDASKLEVVVSKDFAGDFEKATWTVVKDASFEAGSQMNVWEEVVVSLSDYASESSLCVALKYTGKSNTYRIDDVKFSDGKAAPSLSVNPENKTLAPQAGSFDITVNSNTKWSVSSDNPEFTLSQSEGEGNATVTVSYTENTSSTKRVAEILFTSGDLEALCTVTQLENGAQTSGDYTSNVDITSQDAEGTKFFIEEVIIDDETYSALKLGTSKVGGSYTTASALPVTGEVTLSLYALGWNGKSSEVTITINNAGTINGSESVTLTLVSNDGIANTSPYTVTVSEDNFYTLNLSGVTSATTLTFSTSDSKPRCVIFGANVK